jgi:hypothetical protein
MDREDYSYSENSENESVGTPSSSCESTSSVSSSQSFPVADGVQYRKRAEFLRALKKLGGRRRAFTARCFRSRSSSLGEDEETLSYNRLCVPEENGLTADDISRLQCRPGGTAVIRKSPSLQRSRTYRNPTRA